MGNHCEGDCCNEQALSAISAWDSGQQLIVGNYGVGLDQGRDDVSYDIYETTTAGVKDSNNLGRIDLDGAVVKFTLGDDM